MGTLARNGLEKLKQFSTCVHKHQQRFLGNAMKKFSGIWKQIYISQFKAVAA